MRLSTDEHHDDRVALATVAAAVEPGISVLDVARAYALRPLAAQLARVVSGPVETARCPRPAGPPLCWCRPPLPGLPLAFARARTLDPGRSILVGTGPAQRVLARALAARYLDLATGAA